MRSPITPVNALAKQRLNLLAAEAREKIKNVDSQLAAQAEQFATSEKLGVDGQLPDEWKQAVTAAFNDYESLRDTYDSVPAVRGELKSRLTSARRRPEYAAALQQQEASELCEVARQHERDQEQCCAYWVYKEAAKLAPAPATRLAAQQVARMDQDEQLLAAATKCKELKECHKLFNRAESVVATWPARALELLAQITHKAPPDSTIHRAARQRMQEIEKG